MKRKDFLKRIGLGALGVAVAPTLLSKDEPRGISEQTNTFKEEILRATIKSIPFTLTLAEDITPSNNGVTIPCYYKKGSPVVLHDQVVIPAEYVNQDDMPTLYQVTLPPNGKYLELTPLLSTASIKKTIPIGTELVIKATYYGDGFTPRFGFSAQ